MFWILLPLAALAAYHSPVFSGRLVHYDDPILIEPMAGMSSFTQWLDVYRDNQIWDIQLVRDLTLWIDAKLTLALGFETFHLTNLLIWLAACGLLKLVLTEVTRRPGMSSIAALGFSIWPTFASSVGLAASRRHLLCLAFTLAATLVFLRNRQKLTARVSARLCLLYALSVLSHGMSILWPAWCVAFIAIERWPRKSVSELRSRASKEELKKLIRHCLPLAPMLALGPFFAWLTLYYYQTRYLAVTGKDYFYGVADWGERVLGLGRSFVQILIPFRFSLSYDLASPLNLVGLPLGLGLLFWVYRRVGPRILLQWLAFFFAVLTPAVTRSFFIVDLYLLLPSVALLILILLSLPAMHPAYRVAVPLVLLLAIARTTFVAGHLTSALDLWAISNHDEPSEVPQASYAFYLFDRDVQAALAQVNDLEEHRCALQVCVVASAMKAYYAPLPPAQKEILIRQNGASSFFGDLLLAAFLAQQTGREAAVDKLLQGLYGDPIFIRLFGSYEGGPVQDLRKSCATSKLTGCALFLAKHRTKMRYY